MYFAFYSITNKNTATFSTKACGFERHGLGVWKQRKETSTFDFVVDSLLNVCMSAKKVIDWNQIIEVMASVIIVMCFCPEEYIIQHEAVLIPSFMVDVYIKG